MAKRARPERRTAEAPLAVVTGASGVVGSAISLAFAERGMRLVLCGRDARRIEDLVRRARKASPEVVPFVADLTRDIEVQRLGQLVRETAEHLDVLVHSMGVYAEREIERVSLVEFDHLFGTNVRAPFAVSQALLPIMRGRSAHMVFLNSGIGLPRAGGHGVYAATKHALKAFVDFLREEVNPDGIRVVTVALARSASPLGETIGRMGGKSGHARRLARPEDIASAVVSVLDQPAGAEVAEILIRPFQKPASAAL